MNNKTKELCHHGIRGQKWGLTNGPVMRTKASSVAVSRAAFFFIKAMQ